MSSCFHRLPAGSFTARKRFFTKQTAQLSSTSLLTDLVDGWCDATSAQMGLHTPEQYIRLQAAAAHVRDQELLHERESRERLRSGERERQRTADAVLQLRKQSAEGLESGGGAAEGEPARSPLEGQPQQQQQQQQLRSVLSDITVGISRDPSCQRLAEQNLQNGAGVETPIGLPVQEGSPQLEGAAAGEGHRDHVGGAAAVDGVQASRQLPRSRSWISGRDTWIDRLSTELEAGLQVWGRLPGGVPHLLALSPVEQVANLMSYRSRAK